jgi:class 3 adenylate cyclase
VTDPSSNSPEDLIKKRLDLDAELEGKQTEVAILFADVVGSTEFYDQYGNIDGAVMVHKFLAALTPLVESHAGKVFKTLGDGVLGRFERPDGAVACAVAMSRALADRNAGRAPRDQLHMRIGVNWGTGLVTSTDVIGDVVNMAQRVQSMAQIDEILVSQSLHDQIQDTGDFRIRKRLEEVELKGKAGRHNLYEVQWYADDGKEGASVTPGRAVELESSLLPLFRRDRVFGTVVKLYERLGLWRYALCTLAYMVVVPGLLVAASVWLEPEPSVFAMLDRGELVGACLIFAVAPIAGSYAAHRWLLTTLNLPAALANSGALSPAGASGYKGEMVAQINRLWLSILTVVLLVPIAVYGLALRPLGRSGTLQGVLSVYIACVSVGWWYLLLKAGVVVFVFLAVSRRAIMKYGVKVRLFHADSIFGLCAAERVTFSFLILYAVVMGYFLIALLGPARVKDPVMFAALAAYIAIPVVWIKYLLAPLRFYISSAKQAEVARVDREIAVLGQTARPTSETNRKFADLQEYRKRVQDLTSWPIGRARQAILMVAYALPPLVQCLQVATH